MTWISVDPVFFLATLGMAAFGPILAFILGRWSAKPETVLLSGDWEIDSGE